MKTKLAVFFLLVGVALVAFLGAQTQPKKPFKQPEMKTDPSAVNEGRAPAVVSYADTLESVRSAVVSVYSTKIVRQQLPEMYRRFFGIDAQPQRQDGLGSGVIVSSDGYILTNNHVVEEADQLKVLLSDEREYIATVVGTDPKTDIAVIKIDARNLPAAILADSDRLRVGDVVFAIGNPLGVGQTVTMGIVSATGRKNVNLLTDRDPEAYEDFIQTDAAINFGNSGGALVDAKGRLVGINSGIATNNRGNIGIGFAVPINLAKGVMTSLIEHGTVVRGYMGIEAATLTPDLAESFGLPRDTRGVILTNVTPDDGPAARAGLKREDVVTAINGRAITSWEDIRIVIAQVPPGATAVVKYFRDGKPMTANVVMGRREDAIAEILRGVTLEPLTAQVRRQLRIDDRVDGLVITEIKPDSPHVGTFPEGSVIISLNRIPVTDLEAARQAIVPRGRNVALVYYRGTFRFVTFQL
jgi:Do/DeqQ family serine protease